ncbi:MULTISPECIES: DUF7527 domain-containing protein [Natrialbaceae]|uniref:DUF7527 domain-containing protein n=1 Tax=Natrialbaceae TaxID=1644061 RepID=UPI00207C3642|nr:transcriptional regulator [Natronococcus sp. CG52]
MDSRTQERVEQWDSRAFSGGYDGLRTLVDSDFSGAVTAARSWLFLLNGRIVGTVDGVVDDFENESGTRYEAPHPSLPLLCAMEEQGGETRAKYYTNETPLREVDETLRNSSFTGYVELSENVLSGDYYVIYYGGRRMAAAYIGSAERLLTGDEAFERAADEVGIYEVIDVEIEVEDVPRADDSTPDSDATESTDGSNGSNGSNETDETDETDGTDERPTTEPRPSEPEGESAPNPRTDSATPAASSGVSSPAPDSETSNAASGITTADETDADQASTTGITDAAPESGASNAQTESSGPDQASERDETIDSPTDTADDATTETDADEASADADEPDTETSDDESARTDSSPDPEVVEAAARELDRQDIDWVDDDSEGGEQPEDAELEERFEQEEQWRETRSIPSIDPDNTEASDAATPAGGSGSARREDAAGNRSRPESTQTSPSKSESGRSSSQSERQSDRTQRSDATTTEADDERRAKASQQLEQLEKQRNALRTKVQELEAERDQLRSKNQQLSSTVDKLRSRVEELETELERARAAGETERERAGGAQLSRKEALSGTNLFVRYASKSRPTLETAHDGGADRGEVESNLRLEHHTQFDESDAVVDGDPYEEALTSSMEYRFVDWLTSVVLYEIRDTGHADALSDLYDAIPMIDRAELHATISLEDDETEDVPDQVGFDVVAYDKMGSPLLVANLNDSREPASQAMLEEMEEAASAVKANYPDLASAIVVTSSYFEPGALEVVERATSGGFLSRGSRLSYVNLSRKQGYHLCLAESRSEGFHMNVPEL